MLSLIYKEYQHEKTLRKAQLETKKRTMLVSIDEMTNGLLTKIDENVSKVFFSVCWCHCSPVFSPSLRLFDLSIEFRNTLFA
uniref:Transposase n=1 Tax=Schistosoma mansoni TaxID=6183 RepID=A0AA82N422_SCHMA